VICETNWSNGLPYSVDIDPYYWDFGNGYIPFFAVVGAYNVLYYGDNAVTGAMGMVPDAVDSFNNLGLTGPVEDQVIFFNEVLSIDISEVFSSPNGDVTVTVDDNTNPSVAGAEITGTTLTITAMTTMGQTMITLMGDDGVMTATDEFYVTVLDPNPNTETLEFTLEDTPEQLDWPNNVNQYENTYTDLGWTSVTVEEDAAIISMHITGDLFSDNYATEGSFWMTSPTGTTIMIADGFSSGTNAVDFEIGDFVTQPSCGEWIIYFEDSYGDGGHALYDGTFVIEIAGAGAPVVAPTNLEAAVTDDDVHLTWEYEAGGGEAVILAWDNGINDDAIGLTNGGDFAVASRWTPTELVNYHNMPINMISLFPNEAGSVITLKIWTGADAVNEVYSQDLSDLVIAEWNEIVLDTPYVIDAADELWFGYALVGQPASTYPAGCDAGPAVAGFGDMITMDGVAWDPLSGYGLDYNWNLQATAGGRVMQRHSMPQEIEVAKLHNDLFSQANLHNSSLRDRLLLGFNVYRDDAEIAYIEDIDAREYDDMDLADGTYEYYVTAVYDTTESNASNTVEVVINMNPTLDPPAGVSVDENGLITWMEPGTGLGSILLVDDDGSIDLDFTDTVPYYETILDASGMDYEIYEITTAGNDGPDADYMADYDLVIWDCGEQWASARTLSQTDESELGEYLDNGGYLVLCAHDYLWDRYPNAGSFSAGQFPYDYLGVDSAIQDAFTVGVSQGGPEMVDIVGQGATAGLTVGLQDIFSAMRDGVYLDFLTPNANGSAYSTYNDNNVGVQTTNTIFTTAGWAGLIDGDNTVLEYALASFSYLRPLENYNVYLDGEMVGDTTDLMYQLNDLVDGETYTAGVSANYTEGESGIVEVEFTYNPSANDGEITGVNSLIGNYPNPFNPECKIAFALAEDAEVTLSIYNVRGQRIRTLVNETMTSGTHDVIWDGTDDRGASVASGVYYYKMDSGKFTSSKKMVLMK